MTSHTEKAVSDSGPAREHVLDLDADRLGAVLATLGCERYRAGQIQEWIYKHGATTFDQMTNLPKLLRATLGDRLLVSSSRIIRRAASRDGTVKLLLQWPDGATSECVMIPSDRRFTACLSSQVGCPAGCRFCASGLDGLQRNLTTGEIVEQVLRMAAETRDAGGSLQRIVFMGLGEPLANYDAVVRSVRAINAPWGADIGARKITISTVGLPRQIRRLATEGLQVNLALSLHAPTDGLRAELIPWAEQISLADLAAACAVYFEKTGREITIEYVLLAGKNDRQTHAAQLARFAGRFRCNVNLIRYNPVDGLPYERPTSESTYAFQQSLREHGVNAHVRTSRGRDIDAACGQLRRREAVRS